MKKPAAVAERTSPSVLSTSRMATTSVMAYTPPLSRRIPQCIRLHQVSEEKRDRGSYHWNRGPRTAEECQYQLQLQARPPRRVVDIASAPKVCALSAMGRSARLLNCSMWFRRPTVPPVPPAYPTAFIGLVSPLDSRAKSKNCRSHVLLPSMGRFPHSRRIVRSVMILTAFFMTLLHGEAVEGAYP